MYLNTIGLSVIAEAFESAAYMFTHTGNVGKRTKYDAEMQCESRKSLAYIRGTGLEMTIKDFGLDCNAEMLRKNFFTMFNHKEYLD